MKFSIITICYNSGKTLENTLKSILTQTYKDYEYIIVDGGSEDSTLDIVRQYEPLFLGRMNWKSEPDKGIYNAMNKGIQRATGDIIGIVNSDDWLEPNALEYVGKAVSKNNINLDSPFIISGNIRFRYEDGATVIMKSSWKRFEKYAKRYRMGLNHPATFVSRKAYDEVGVFDENIRLFADTDLMVRMYNAKVPFTFIDDVLSNMADGGASNQSSKYGSLDRKYILAKHSANKAEYIYLRVYEWLEKQVKRMPYSWVKKYRSIKNR